MSVIPDILTIPFPISVAPIPDEAVQVRGPGFRFRVCSHGAIEMAVALTSAARAEPCDSGHLTPNSMFLGHTFPSAEFMEIAKLAAPPCHSCQATGRRSVGRIEGILHVLPCLDCAGQGKIGIGRIAEALAEVDRRARADSRANP